MKKSHDKQNNCNTVKYRLMLLHKETPEAIKWDFRKKSFPELLNL